MSDIDGASPLAAIDLEAAYRATTYRVFLPGGAVDVRIGEANAELAAWLAGEGASTWAILTANNPGSRLLEASENAERQSQLECILLEQGFLTFSGENLADDGVWPNEESCLVVGINVKNSIALAQQFGQNGLVFGEGDGLGRLIGLIKEKQQEKN